MKNLIFNLSFDFDRSRIPSPIEKHMTIKRYKPKLTDFLLK